MEQSFLLFGLSSFQITGVQISEDPLYHKSRTLLVIYLIKSYSPPVTQSTLTQRKNTFNYMSNFSLKLKTTIQVNTISPAPTSPEQLLTFRH